MATLTPQFLAGVDSAAINAATKNNGLNLMPGIHPGTAGIAHSLLNSGQGLKFNSKQLAPRNSAGPSVISRILDILSRPLYAVGASAYDAQAAASNHQSFMDQLKALGGGILGGLEGKEKITPADWIQESHDINAQKAATGDTAGFTPGQGKGLNTAEKIFGFGLNLATDPLNKIAPIGIARKVGEATGAFTIPTMADVSRKVLNKLPSGQATTAAMNEAGPNLGSINLPTFASGKPVGNALGDAFRNKFGEVPSAGIQENLTHPHIDSSFSNGKYVSKGLTPQGIEAANNLRSTYLQSGLKANAKNAEREITNNALQELNGSRKLAKASQYDWINKVTREGIKSSAAQRIVKEVNGGKAFDEAVRNAVGPATKIAKISDLGEKLGKGVKPGFRLSSVLAPTTHEALSAIERATPAGKIITTPEEQMRARALSMPLGPNAERIKNEVKPEVIRNITQKGGGAFSSAPQADMWNTIRSRVQQERSKTFGKNASQIPLINGATFHIATHLEEELAKEGHLGTDVHGNPAKITEAVIHTQEFPNKLSELGTRIVDNYAADQKAGVVPKAKQAIAEATAVQPAVQVGVKIAAALDNRPELSDPLKFLGKQTTASGVEKAIGQITGSSRAARAGKQIYKAIVENANTSSMDALQKAGNVLSEIVTTGKIPANYGKHIAELGRGIARDLGIPDPKSAGMMIGPMAAAETGWLGRMASWYGQHDLRPLVLARMAEARTNAALWSKLYSDTFQGLSKAERVEAFRTAQGLFDAANPGVAKAAEAIRTRMENLFSASGLSDSVLKGNTQAFRAGLTIKELNDELRRVGSDFRFTDGEEVKNLLGDTTDYSKNADWLKSWESHELKGRPEKFLAQLESAVWGAMGKRALYDEIISRFGSFSRNAEQTTGIRDFRYLQGHFFHPEVAQQIQRVNRDLFSSQTRQNDALRFLDSVMRMWKTNVTIYSPSHSIHNGMGDIINSFLFAGVKNPNVYRKAISVLRAHARDYRDLEKLAPYLNPETLPEQVARSVPGSRVIVKTKDGQGITADQIYMAAHREGILQTVGDIEDINFGSVPHFQPFGGAVHNFAHGVVQGMDHFTRLGHFIDAIAKSSGPLNEIFRNAGNDVRRIHPDGMDLTNFERNVLRRVIPFYSWTRKTVPFMVQGLLAKPSKFMIYPKATYAAIQGQPGTSLSQQFPSQQMFPGWINDMGVGPIGGPGGLLNSLTGGPQAFTEASLSVPPMDVLQTYHNPLAGVLGGLNPLIKAPIELYQGQQIDSGVPTGGTLQYLSAQLPAINLIQRLSNVGLGGLTTKGQTQGIGNQQAIANYLTGLKLVNTGNYIKSANWEQRQREKAQAKNNAAKILAAIQSAQASVK